MRSGKIAEATWKRESLSCRGNYGWSYREVSDPADEKRGAQSDNRRSDSHDYPLLDHKRPCLVHRRHRHCQLTPRISGGAQRRPLHSEVRRLIRLATASNPAGVYRGQRR